MTAKRLSIEEEIQLYSDSLKNEISNIKERFKWAREQERAAKVDDLYLWKNVLSYYMEARNCYCCGLYYAAIALMSSTIEVGFKQIFLDNFPDLHHKIMKNRKFQKFEYIIKEAHSKGFISSKLKEGIDRYRSKFRNLAIHPHPYMPLMFGGRELAPGSWVVKNFDDLRTPEDVAKEGLIYFLQLCKEFDDWKRNHDKNES